MTGDANVQTEVTTAKTLPQAEESSPKDSFLYAAASAADAMASDVECQQASQLPQQFQDDSASSEKPQADPFGIDSRGDEETASVLSVDSSQEKKTKFRDILTSKNVVNNNNIFWNTDDDRVPFPSIEASIHEYNRDVNVCPCRCLFFTLKETLCMVMSALGCAVFITGLVFLCLFLEGSWFQDKQ